MKASIIICTYNRSKLLGETIQSVQKQDFPYDQYEIIVVDNNSTDDTESIVKDMASASPVRIEYVFEKNQGLSHARNAGIKKAKGEIIVFTDDDVEAEPQWLKELVTVFDDPKVAAAGGPIRPVWLSERPEWLTDRWLSYYAIGEFPAAREAGEFKIPECPWGANIAFRRDVFKTTGLFPTDLGRIGDCLLSNEEINICKKIYNSGGKILFAANAVVNHKVPPVRLKKLWLLQRRYWQGRSDAVLDATSDIPNIYSALRYHASLTLRHGAEKNESEFELKCTTRVSKGYVHQLLFSDYYATTSFRKLRVLETFIRELLNISRNLVAQREKKISELTEAIDRRNRDIAEKEEKLGEAAALQEKIKRLDNAIDVLGKFRNYEGLFKEKAERLAALESEKERYKEELAKKTAEIMALDSDIKRFQEDIRQKDEQIAKNAEQLKLKDEQILKKEDLIRQKDKLSSEQSAQLKLKDEELLKKEDLIRQKDKLSAEQSAQLKLRDEELLKKEDLIRQKDKLSSEQSAQLKLRDEQLRSKNAYIEELRASMSWKITAPLRAAYELVLRKNIVTQPIMSRLANYLPDPATVNIERSLMWKFRFAGYAMSLNRKFKDIHKGKEAFLIGSGPSVRLEDLQHLKGNVTFVCNRFYLCYDKTDFRPTYLLSSDPQMVGDFGKEMSEKAGCPVFFNTADDMVKAPNVYWIPSTHPHRDPLVFQEKLYRGIFCGGATLISAVQIAYFMGIRKFYLYGVDHSFKFDVVESKDKFRSAEGDQNHFIPNYRNGKRWCPPATQLIEDSFQICDKFLRERGGFIKNATRGGQLEVLERADFDEVVRKRL